MIIFEGGAVGSSKKKVIRLRIAVTEMINGGIKTEIAKLLANHGISGSIQRIGEIVHVDMNGDEGHCLKVSKNIRELCYRFKSSCEFACSIVDASEPSTMFNTQILKSGRVFARLCFF